MKRTVINKLLLLLLSLVCIVSISSAQNYDERCFIVQFKAGTEQVEIDDLLNTFNLYIKDGPTTAFNNQFYLICIDSLLGFPDIAVNNNGEVDINGVILNVITVDDNSNEILDASGLNYEVDLPSPPTGNPTPVYHHPLAECGQSTFSIDTYLGDNQTNACLLDTGIKTESGTGIYNFYDPFDLGWNIIEDTADPTDDNGHGTHMSSSITLATAPNFASVLDLKAYKTHDILGSASIWSLIEGIDKALLADVHIINMSNSYQAPYAHRFSDAPLKTAIEEALDIAGVLFVTAAGNKGVDNDDPSGLSNYPASFQTDNILAVAALDCNYNIPYWSNDGASSVDIAAPGVDIWGLNHDLLYIKMSGSSSATALTSRVAAMLATQQSVFDYVEIKCAIMNGANQPPNAPLETLSEGYLDANMAQVVFDAGNACNVLSGPGWPGNSGGSGSGSGRSNNNALNASIQNGALLSITSDKEQMANLRVFNILGQTLYSKEITLQVGQNNFNLEIPNQPLVGAYICQLQYGSQSKTIKFVK